MKKNKNGITLLVLIISIIILLILAGVTVSAIWGDNGIVTKAIKMELDTAKGEVRDHILLLLNEELLSASSDIAGTAIDISTRYNEPKLVNFLKGNQNYTGTDHDDIGAIACIEEFPENKEQENGVIDLTPKAGEGIVKSKYRIISTAVCPDGDKYGIGKNINDGNIFTLEAVITKDDQGNDVYEGKYQLKYYDKDKNPIVMETVSLYLTNQS